MDKGMVCRKLYRRNDFQELLPSNLLASHQMMMKKRILEKMKAELNPVIVRMRHATAKIIDME